MTPEQSAWFAETFDALVENVGKAVLGNEHVVRLAAAPQPSGPG